MLEKRTNMTEKGTLEWLMEGPSYVRYRTMLDLLHLDESNDLVIEARSAMLSDPNIRSLTSRVKEPWRPLNSHRSASHPIHVLEFLSDMGLKADDLDIRTAIDRLMANISEEGQFRVPMVIPKHFGGSGVEEMAWVICDAPMVVSSLARMGLDQDPRVLQAAKMIASLSSEKGWLCKGSKEIGKFRGPGKKDDPCPYATLISLRALSEFPDLASGDAVKFGAECLLDLWENSREKHPYQFYMGTDFRKVKAPLVWYDILHVADVLSLFKGVKDDPRYIDMILVLSSKVDSQGRAIPESVWQDYKDWEFGQKKVPSRWATFLYLRVLSRSGTSV
jgi:hypothetical protein